MKNSRRWIQILAVVIMISAAMIGPKTMKALAEDRICEVEISADKLGKTSTFQVEGKPVSITASNYKNAIQKVFDYAKNLKNVNGSSYDSLKITFKKGQYDLEGTLFIYSNTSVVCEEGTEIRSAWEYGTLLRTAPLRNLDNGKVSDEMIQNISVNGGKWNGMNKPGTIFRFSLTSNVMMDHVEVCNLKDTGHLVALEAVKNVTIQNSKFYNHQITAGAKETDSSEAIHIDFTRGSTDISKEEETDYPCTNIVIQNNEIHDVPTGVGSHNAMNGVTHKNITIQNNVIYNTTGNAIRSYRYRNARIQGNTISNVTGAISIDIKGSNVYTPARTTPVESAKEITEVYASSNTISNVKGNAIWVVGSSAYPYNGVQITNNTIREVGETAVTIRDYCYNTLVQSNTIENAGQYGVQVNNYCKGLKVDSNNITGTKKHAIAVRLNSHNSTVSNNVLNGLGEAGIVIYTKCNNAKISGNTINSPTQDGILLKDNCKKASISNNTITSAKKCGITVNNKVSTVAVSNNKITNAKSTAIYIKDSVTSANIKSNIIINPSSMGISLINKCNNGKIQSNKITGGTYAISVKSKCLKPFIKSNTIKNSKKHGIQLLDQCNNGTISYNTITNAKSNGIHLNNKCVKTTIANNRLTTIKCHGISLMRGSSQCSLKNNTVKNAKGKGIYTNGVKKTVSKKNHLINCKKK